MLIEDEKRRFNLTGRRVMVGPYIKTTIRLVNGVPVSEI